MLCLQETKVVDQDFPVAAFRALGYRHIVLHGQRMHHGVAILSRVPLAEDDRFDWQANREARHVGVRLENGLRLENVYVPAGGDVPDRDANPKFGQKLDFVERMTRWSEALTLPTVLVGDLNIAPLESDVWSHRQLLNTVSHTPVEVAALNALKGLQFVGRSRTALLSGTGAAAHVVELSLARLDGQRPRTATRPYVGDPPISPRARRGTMCSRNAAAG